MKSGSESRGINLALSPALNTALREEMLFFATQGSVTPRTAITVKPRGVLTQSSATLSTHIGGVGVETRWHVRHYNTAQYAFEFQEDVGDGTDDSIASVGVEKHRRGSSRFGSFFRSTKRSSDAGLEISNTSTWPKVNSSADSSSQMSSFDEKGSTPSTDYRPATKPSLLLPPPEKGTTFYFRSLSPELFRRIRHLCGIFDDEFSRSFESITKERFSEGASGAFMFFTGDQRFIVKTMTKTEASTLESLLPDYIAYLTKVAASTDHKLTLITKYFSCHCLTMYRQKMYFVVMENVFYSRSAKRVVVDERYDLKGSWVSRRSSRKKKLQRKRRFGLGGEEEMPLSRDNVGEQRRLLKDNELGSRFLLHDHQIRILRECLNRDVDFLSSKGLMDYSLLAGLVRERRRPQVSGR